MKRLLFALMFVGSVFAVSAVDDGYEPPFPEEYLPEGWFFTGESAFSVVSEDDRTAAFRAYCGKTEGNSFTFPSQCERKGETYTVVSLMDAPDRERYVIPATVTQIQPGLFAGQSVLSIEVDENNETFTTLDGVLYDKNMSTLVSWPGGIKYNGTLPETVEHIGDYAFYFHRQSDVVFTLPSSVKTIGKRAFTGSGFEEFRLHDSLESIGEYAFSDCFSLKSFDIPASVTYLGPAFVANGHGVHSLTVAEDNQSFVAVDGNVYTRDMSTLVMFAPGRKDEITIPDGVTKILEGAFCCSVVKSVTIPESVRTIDFRTFYGARELVSITLPEGLSSIGQYAFYYAYKLKELVVPDMVESIGENAFQETALTRLVIGENVSSIGDYAFDKVSVLKWEMDPMLVVRATTPPVVGNYCKSLYYYPLYVPKGYAEVYAEAPFWNEFNEIHEYGNLSVSMPDMTLKVGDTTESVISFEKDDDVTVVSESWTSGDPSVLTVDQDGMIEAVGRGETTLNYVAKDNYGIPHKASCLVSVSTDTGIDGITDAIGSGETSVYNLQGVYVGTDCSHLQPGLYIISKNGRTKKVMVN